MKFTHYKWDLVYIPQSGINIFPTDIIFSPFICGTHNQHISDNSILSGYPQTSTRLYTLVIHSLRESELCLDVVYSSMTDKILSVLGLDSAPRSGQ